MLLHLMIRKEGPHTNVGNWAPSYLATLLGSIRFNHKIMVAQTPDHKKR